MCQVYCTVKAPSPIINGKLKKKRVFFSTFHRFHFIRSRSSEGVVRSDFQGFFVSCESFFGLSDFTVCYRYTGCYRLLKTYTKTVTNLCQDINSSRISLTISILSKDNVFDSISPFCDENKANPSKQRVFYNFCICQGNQ